MAQSTYGLSSITDIKGVEVSLILLLVMIRLSMIGPIVASLGSSPIPPLPSSALEEKSQFPKSLELGSAHLNFSRSLGVANSVFIPFTENNRCADVGQFECPTHIFKALGILLDAVNGFCQGDQL